MKDIEPVNPSIYPSQNPCGIKIPFYINKIVDKFVAVGMPYPVAAEDLRRAMKISDILKTVNDCEMLRNVLLTDQELTTQNKAQICDLLWDYRCELLKKEVE